MKCWPTPILVRHTRRSGSELAIHAMARALRYHPLFDSDVLNAAEWYDCRQPSLGADFVVRVRRAADQLTADPEVNL